MCAEPVPSQPVPLKPAPRGPKYLTRPASEDPKDLGFERRPMVDWLAPAQLARTGIKAVLSGVFGAYADKREVMAALYRKPDHHDYSERDEIWIDYIADLGDGFDATYTLATLLASPRLTLGDRETRRGDILILGGDQVYPTASFEEYNNRLLMPYRAALPCVLESEPHLYAVPGNHDWYDGLSNFTRIFCQRRWIGGWKTQQRRSYFALKLPRNWWLWAIDIQLEGFIDDPQLEYFRRHAEGLRAEDRIILCTAEPSWVYAVTKGPDAFRSLSFFEDNVIRKAAPSQPQVTLTGDLHHYTRYQSADGQTQRITAGGGGAYLYATHQMPASLRLKEGKEREGDQVEDRERDYSLEKTFPSPDRSRMLALGSIRLPWRSWRFGVFLASFYTLYAWIVQSASKARPDLGFPSLMHHLNGLPASWQNLGEALKSFGIVLAHDPASVFLTLLILGGLIAFCAAKRTAAKVLIGSLHGAAHILLNVLLIWLFARINPGLVGRDIDSWQQVLAFALEMLVVGGFLGGFLMAIYLMLCSSLGKFHTNEVFSSQRIADYKNFLRLHIDSTGKLTIYPVGVPQVCKDWQFQPAGELHDPWWTPKQPIQAELIEKPIEVA